MEPMYRELWQDVRYAARVFPKQPVFAAAAVLTLALGIGATSAIFSVVLGVLLKPLPFFEPERLVSVAQIAPHGAGANGIDWMVLLFTASVSVLSGGVCGALAVIRFGKPSITALKEGGDRAPPGQSRRNHERPIQGHIRASRRRH
jgi:hypothetical protein